MGIFKRKIIEAPKKEERSTTIINKDNVKKFIIQVTGLISKQSEDRQGFSHSEFNLEEIRIASLSDSYIKQALMKYSYLIYKAGYQIKGENEKASEYIKKRFRIMDFATVKPMDILFQEVADDMVKYSNAFLIKSRVDNVFPGIKAVGIYSEKPVGGYFRICPSTMRIKKDDYGKITKYQQIVNGIEKNYSPNDVIHFYLDKEPNNSFGTPRIVAALEDVKLLRKIEGNVIALIYRFAIPIYQWIVGLPEKGYEATDTEIQEAKREIEKASADAVIVTNERTSVKAIGAEGEALDASPYLSYFEKRVFAALGVSESQMGRGGSKKDADSMEAQAHDVVKHIQRTLSIFIENFIINELLLEGGFNPIVNEEDVVRYIFNEISLETKIKLENHDMLKFQSNVSTIEETRRDLGKKESIDESRIYSNLIDNKKALEQIKAKTDGAKELKKMDIEASKESDSYSTGINGNGKPSENSNNDDVKSRNLPSNQYGTTSVKIKENSKSLQAKSRNLYKEVFKKYDTLRNDIGNSKDSLDVLFPLGRDSILKEIYDLISWSSYDGKNDAIKESGIKGVVDDNKIIISELQESSKEKITELYKDIKSKIEEGYDKDVVFESLEYRLRFLLEYVVPKSYWYSFAKTCHNLGIEKLYVDFNGSSDSEEYDDIIYTNKFSLESVPAFHSYCDCKLSIKKKGAK